jgi:NO-binding membrane sensor protein with MHYT domain
MNKRNRLIIGVIAVVSIAAYLLDYVWKAARQYTSANFDMTATILSLIVPNLIFAAIAVWAVVQTRKQEFSPAISGLMILLGLAMVVLPFTGIRAANFLPYGDYSNIAGSLWIVLGVISLFGSKATAAGHG